MVKITEIVIEKQTVDIKANSSTSFPNYPKPAPIKRL